MEFKKHLYNSVKELLKKLYYKIFYYKINYKLLEQELQTWKTNFRPPGHYYSPYPDSKELNEKRDLIFRRNAADILPGIDLQTDSQFALLQSLADYYNADMFPLEKKETHRYYFDNQYFSFSDAIFLACMIRQLKPKRIIEIGSGFSSAVMLDVNEEYFNNSIQLTFVEPYPEERLNGLVNGSDNYTIRKEFVQNVPVSIFTELEENDILFIDSSHISKTYSDVNHLIFNVIPFLKKGVVIHVHDIFFPFEYPAEWMIDQQRAWNEAYILRAFLQFNPTFSIELFTSYLEIKFKDWFLDRMPLCLEKHEKWPRPDGSFYYLDTAGQSLYLRKVK